MLLFQIAVVTFGLIVTALLAALAYSVRKDNLDDTSERVETLGGATIFYRSGKEVFRCGASADRKAEWRNERHLARMEQLRTASQVDKWLPRESSTHSLVLDGVAVAELRSLDFGTLEARISDWEKRWFPPVAPSVKPLFSDAQLQQLNDAWLHELPSNVVDITKARK